MFSKCFRGEYMWQLRKNLKGWWCGSSNVNDFDYFPVSCAGVGSVGMHQLKYNNLRYDLLEIFVPISPLPPAFFFTLLSTLRSPSLCGMTYSKYLCQSLPLSPAFFSFVFLLFVLLLLRKKSNLPLLQQDRSWFKGAISRIRNILLAWNLARVFVHFIISFNLPDSGL